MSILLGVVLFGVSQIVAGIILKMSVRAALEEFSEEFGDVVLDNEREQGFVAGLEARDSLNQADRDSEYEKGYHQGHEEGYDLGYSEGRQFAWTDDCAEQDDEDDEPNAFEPMIEIEYADGPDEVDYAPARTEEEAAADAAGVPRPALLKVAA